MPKRRRRSRARRPSSAVAIVAAGPLPEPPRRVLFALAIHRDGLVSAAAVSRLHRRLQARAR